MRNNAMLTLLLNAVSLSVTPHDAEVDPECEDMVLMLIECYAKG